MEVSFPSFFLFISVTRGSTRFFKRDTRRCILNSPLPLPKTSQTILLAEDEPEVRSYLEMALRGQGYTIETADDGEEALEILELNPNISAVLLDIVMPRRDGLETLREIRKTNTHFAGHHGLRCVFAVECG